MRLIKVDAPADPASSSARVRVPCIRCGKLFVLSDGYVDLDGPSFKAYYCTKCVPPHTAREIKWDRRLCIIMVPAGLPVIPCKDSTGQYWIDDFDFLRGNFYLRDAIHYGIRVNPEDVSP